MRAMVPRRTAQSTAGVGTREGAEEREQECVGVGSNVARRR